MEDVISYKPIIQDFTWSYSRIEAYKSCKWKFFLRYIRELQEKEMFYSSYGKFMHKIIEKFYSGELTKDEMLTEFLSRYSDEVHGARPANINGSSYIKKGIEYLKKFKPFPYKMIAVEKRINFNIDGIPFTGIIDYIGKKNNEYYIVDNKSRDLKQRSKREKPTMKDRELDEMLRQLYLYSVAIEQEYGKLPKALCFNCFKNGEFIVEPFDIDKYTESKKWVIDSIRDIENNANWDDEEYEFFRCNYLCGLHDQCQIYLDEREW